MASVILRSHRKLNEKGETVVTLQRNTLSILGTKDGLLRISRGAEAFYSQLQHIAPNQPFTHSLLAIEGTSHASFMDETLLPSFVLSNDLPKDVDQATGYTLIAQSILGFIQD